MQNKAQLPANLFDEAATEVKLILADIFPRFCKTSLYKNVKDEMEAVERVLL